MASMEVTRKRLALAIIDFLNTSAKDGTIAADDAENVEIATNCIAEAFRVDASDQTAMKDAVGSKSLLDIYTVYEKLLKGKPSSTTPSTTSSAATSTINHPTSTPNTKTKEEAEKLKSQGNAAIQKRDYNSAIDYYSKALDIVPLNPIYLSNRAAAYSGAGQHEDAVNDAEMAVAADPKFAKAWSRLGFAKYALGDARGSMDAYSQGIDAEGNGGSDAMRKGFETAKRKVQDEGGESDDDEILPSAPRGSSAPGGMPDLSNLASMFGGAGGGGGMPNFAELMQNPMMQQMAQNVMSNPNAMSSILNNPQLRGMMGGGGGDGAGGGGGGGMPDLTSLLQDPSIRDLARNFMGGQGEQGDGSAGQPPGAGRGRGGGS